MKETYIRTGLSEFDNLIPMVQTFLEKDILDIVIDGEKIRGYRTPDAKSIWIRDYSDMMRAFKYFETDLKSTVDHFADTQAENGRLFDYFTVFPEKLPCERENWVKYVRVPVEADVEYRFVKAAFLSWQATGDDLWIQRLMPKMEKALLYATSHPWRWDEEEKLIKRAYTIDTWDFAYTAGKHEWLQFQIDENTYWGFMHGDNSGYYEAFEILSHLYDLFSNPAQAKLWRQKAHEIKIRMNRVCWNGSFYTHFVKKTPVTIPDTDESSQLSLSNPMAINRGVASHAMAVSIIKEYILRKKSTHAFAEWFSIDPPFPDGIFGDEKLKQGAYVNGGIMPLVGGELARAAFNHGFETYGVDILKQYAKMISKSQETYLWYFPDGTPASVDTSTSPEAEPTDGWGSSAMMYGFLEGLAGIEDRSKLFQSVQISPRWHAAGITQAEVQACYNASQSYIGYSFQLKDTMCLLEIEIPYTESACHVMIPEDRKANQVKANRKDIEFFNTKIGQSRYVDFRCPIQKGVTIEIKFEKR